MKLELDELKALHKHWFDAQDMVLPIWQTIADNFYPERSDFLVSNNVGNTFADHLIDSRPLLMRRDLGNSLSSMLRDGQWFEVGVDGNDPDHDGKAWLQWARDRQMKLMNSRGSGFVRATKQGDHDYTTFGQTVISVELNKARTGLLYRNWHLRDCAWFDNPDGSLGGVSRKWRPTARDLFNTFGEKNHREVMKCIQGHKKQYFKEIECFHMVIPSDMYGDEQLMQYPYVSIYVDTTHDHIIEVTGLNYPYYVVPRWQTIAGSPYAYSAATVIALPNARVLQAMTHTLIEAAERLARPPIIATEHAVRSDIDLSPDGITWVHQDYDEKLGASLRTFDGGGGRTWPIGDQMHRDVAEIMRESFFLNTINMPDPEREMTAFEVSERMKQFRRQNLPIFQPIETEYNGQLCEVTFDLCMSSGFLGSPYDIPRSLQGKDTMFKFMSPLTATEGEEKLNLFTQTSQILREAAELDPTVRHNFDFNQSFRDAITGVGAPENWLVSEEGVHMKKQMEAAQQAAAIAAESQAMAA